MNFTKYQGLGNDFVFVEDFQGNLLQQAPVWAPRICDRHFGVGGDGLVLITRSGETHGGIYTMRIFNADGSEAEMCGNAIRCLAKHLLDRGLAEGASITVGTLHDRREVRVETDGYAVDMGQPVWGAELVPVHCQGDECIEQTITAEGQQFVISAVSMGNPHAVVFVEDIDTIPFLQWGPRLEQCSAFPNKTNVEFVQVRSRDSLKVKVWERGVGPTLACGTGACAAAVVAHRVGAADRRLDVELPGGTLKIALGEDNHVWMTGPAEWVFSGEYMFS